MVRSFLADGKLITYVLRVSAKARHVRIVVTPQGVTLIVPQHVSFTRAEAFMKEKAVWLKKHLEAQTSKVKDAPVFLMTGSYHEHKQSAYEYVFERVLFYSGVYGVTYGTIRIKNQKTMWGSCSRKGNLNFNYRIMLIPPHLREYIVVHEICHLLEFNHSQKFWTLVAQQIPGYKACVEELRAYAYSLS